MHNAQNLEMEGQDRLESLEAVVVFVLPLIISVPLYVLGFLAEVPGNYIMYTVYVICSIALTKFNGRPLSKIGLTGKDFLSSFGFSMVPILGSFLDRLIFSDFRLASNVNSLASITNGLLYWSVSGLGQEILFRGLILFSFQRWKGWKFALIVSSVLFGLMHVQQGVAGIIFTIVIGAYWGWVAIKTKNIFGIILSHSLFNFLFSFMLMS